LRQACVSSSIAFLVSLFHSIYSVLCHDFSTVAILLAVVVPIYCNFDSVAYACLATDRWWYMQASCRRGETTYAMGWLKWGPN
jgi:hypothetical protein